jgi:hypothetical protein
MTRTGFRSGASRNRTVIAQTAETCADPSAALDLAALSEENLSAQGMRRLASHVVRCRACQVALATVVQDAHRVESTAKRSCEAARLCDSERAADPVHVHPDVATVDK